MRARVTERDPNLAHQIKLVRVGHKTGVQCLCRPKINFGLIDPDASPWPLYNGAHHDNSTERFVPRDNHTANARVFDVE